MKKIRIGLFILMTCVIASCSPGLARADKAEEKGEHKDGHAKEDAKVTKVKGLINDRIKALHSLEGAYEVKDKDKVKDVEKKIASIDSDISSAEEKDIIKALMSVGLAKHDDAAHHAADAAKKAEMPVLPTLEHPSWIPHEHDNSIFKWAMEQSIWTLAVFILLLIVLRKYAWDPILEGLRKREETIRMAVEEAKLARQETERVREEFRAEMAKAYAEIPKIMEAARKDAAELREDMKARSTAEIQADRDRLRREIETARDQALSEIWSQSAQLATLISAKAIGRSLTEDDQRRLNEEALSSIEDASKNWKGEQRQLREEWSQQK